MTARIKPYHTTQTYWKSILSNLNMIPMNQRNYDWDNEPQIIKFLNDLFDIFENTNFYEKMGSIIYYTGNNDGKEVWDGQQRLITIILILKAISIVSTSNKILCNSDEDKNKAINFSNSIINLLKEDIDSMVDITDRIKEFQDNAKFKDFEVIPKIHCINPYDNEALCEIFNTYIPLINFEKENEIIEDDDDDDDDDDDEHEHEDDHINAIDYEDDASDDNNINNNIKCYICNICNKKINNKAKVDREVDFVRHLTTCHQYDDSKIKSKDTKIYKSYEFICRIIYNKFKNIKKLKEFYQFILNNIDLNVYECDDLGYVSKIFEWENNRGKPVSTLDVIKNSLLSNISNDKKYEIYDKWNELKLKSNTIYSEYGQKIFNCAIQIYDKKISRICEQEVLFKKLIKPDKKDTYNEIQIYFGIVEKLLDIMEIIKNDRYGRLILHTKRCCISWEGYMFFILPIFYFSKKINKDILELITKWLYRNINTKNRIFNNLCYSNEFIDLTNLYIINNNINYYESFSKILQKHKDISINKENYIKNNVIKEWKHSSGTLAKMLLYFLETTKTTDDYYPNLEHDLEHIYPENKKNSLSSPNIIYKLGNLTILESKNSKNGHKGNRSIKDKPFSNKKEQYKESCHKITRELDQYENFEIVEILERTNDLFKLLDIKTDY
jgi:uncharacterized protein with ParB-like and HNH nuclease domain